MSALLLDWPSAAAQGPAAAGGKGWQLAQLGVPVPDGFVIHANASRGRRAGEPVPHALRDALTRELALRDWETTPLAVRSSAPQEDSTQASFAGIHLSRLNVIGVDAVAEAVQAACDSVWEPAAIAYRQRLGLDGEAPAMAVVVMPLLPAVAAGIAFTCDPLSGRDDQLLIHHAHWGLGEALVGGQADGDEYRLQSNESSLTGDDSEGNSLARPEDVFHLTAYELLAAAEGRLPLRQAARRAARRAEILARQADEIEPAVIVEQPGASPAGLPSAEPSAASAAEAAAGRWSGTPVGAGQAQGPACVARSLQQATAMANGDILVAPSTDPAWTPLFLRAGGLVMETAGYLSHGAIVAREFGIPAVVNLPGILSQLADGDMLSVDGHRGTVQRVAAG